MATKGLMEVENVEQPTTVEAIKSPVEKIETGEVKTGPTATR